MSPFKIAIVGAGPAGSALARLLHLANIDVTIFEGEKSPSFRNQGGSLDLHSKTGIAALKECGLFDEFKKLARYDGEAFVLCDKNMKRFINVDAAGADSKLSTDRPEIDRAQLRKLLLDSLPDGLVKWGCHLHKVEETEADGILLHFDHGIEKGFDLIVGADGAWSKIRTVLSDEKPHYAGIGGLSMSISNAETQRPDLYKLINRGSLFSFSNKMAINAQQIGDGSIHISTWAARPEDWVQTVDYDLKSAKEVKEGLANEYSGWADQLIEFTRAADDDSIVPRSLYMLPIGYKWKHKTGVTLLGDAAHVMTPFAGEGVNLALADAMLLAKAIITASKTGSRESLDMEVKNYEEDMFVRATKYQEMTYDMMSYMMFTDDAPNSTIEKYIIRVLTKDMNSMQKPLVKAGYTRITSFFDCLVKYIFELYPTHLLFWM